MSAVAERNGIRTVATSASRPLIVKETLEQEAEQRRLLGEYVARQMKEGTDYGTIPGTDRKTLLKPGAEKLTSLFRCATEFEVIEKIEDWDRNLFYYQFRCRIVSVDTGGVVAEGFGSANSREGKWRWRSAERKCPNCGKSAIIKGKAEYGGGFVCFKKKDGCGAKFNDDDPAITGQAVGRVENDDVATLVNTILKIAKKRSHVDAAITLARCSDLFTQDVEDMGGEDHDAPPVKRQPAPESKPARASLFIELKAGVRELATLRGVLVPEMASKILDSINDHFQVNRENANDCTDDELKWAADGLQKALSKARAEKEAGTAVADPPPVDAHPTIDREPGDDDLSEEPAPPSLGAKRLPPALVDKLMGSFADNGTNWDKVRGNSLAWLGRKLEPNTHLATLSVDDAAKADAFAKAEKAKREAARKQQEAAA